MTDPKFLNPDLIPKESMIKAGFVCPEHLHNKLVDYAKSNKLSKSQAVVEMIEVFFGEKEVKIIDGQRYLKRT